MEINPPPPPPEISEFISQFAPLCDEWDKTEKWIEFGILLDNSLFDLSRKEMLCAQQHLIKAFHLAIENNPETKSPLSEAHAALLRAQLSVVDSIITHVSDNANGHRNQLGAEILQDHFPNYGDLFGLLKTITDKISLSRKSNVCQNEIYDELMKTDLRNLITLHNSLNISLHDIPQNIKKETTKNTTNLLFGIIGIFIGIVGVAVAFLK